jgi:hypothetical protein
MKSEPFFSQIMERTTTLLWRWCSLCTRPRRLVGLCNASSLKQHSVCRHVTSFGNIILIRSNPVFALTPWCFMLSRELANTNVIVFVWHYQGQWHIVLEGNMLIILQPLVQFKFLMKNSCFWTWLRYSCG